MARQTRRQQLAAQAPRSTRRSPSASIPSDHAPARSMSIRTTRAVRKSTSRTRAALQMDDGELPTVDSTATTTTTTRLRAVVIPIKDEPVITPAPKNRKSNASNASTEPSEVFSIGNSSDENQTPATSGSGTPIDATYNSVKREEKVLGKRKVVTLIEDPADIMTDDAKLALQLQHDEYNSTVPKAHKSSSLNHLISAGASDLSDLSDLPSNADISDMDNANDVDNPKAGLLYDTPEEDADYHADRQYDQVNAHSNYFLNDRLHSEENSVSNADDISTSLSSEDDDFHDNEPLSSRPLKRRKLTAPIKNKRVKVDTLDTVSPSEAGSSSRPIRKARAQARSRVSLMIDGTESDDGEERQQDDRESVVSGNNDSIAKHRNDEDQDSFSSGLSSHDDDEEEDPDLDVPRPATNRAQVQHQRRTHRQGLRAMRERAKLEKNHPEIRTMWKTLQKVPRIDAEQAEQPESISRKLKSFQLEGLNWMKKQERTQWKGGLLGDEMGMGKTIQAVSLIMSDYPAKNPTLVAVPPVALMQWTNEINEYTHGKLKVLVYHGTNSKAKNLSVKQLKAFDVIMISYSGLESIHRKETKGWSRGENIVKEASPIHAIHFHRLILDEAHSIKSRTTGVAKACFALKGTYKWCLSGTPVQNRIGEFFSLLRFLEVTPFANYYCKDCSCSALEWSMNKQYRCNKCGCRALAHVSVFNQEILNPITFRESTNEKRKEAMGKLRLLTDRIMLRRMKRDHTSSMELPPKEVIIHNEFFGEQERDFSSSIMTNTTRQFDTYVSRGVMLNNYANIFGLIMQMRQVSDHPDLLLKNKRRNLEGGVNVLVCHICDEPAEEAIRSKCKHEFCRACAKDYVKTCDASGVTADCPRCHIALSIDFDQPDIEQDEEAVKHNSIINRLVMDKWVSSTKIEMLIYDLYKLRSKKQTLKSIVFSQFTSMLQLIEWRLRRAGFNTVMLDGSMSPAQRQKSIEYFMNNTDVEVFLVSLKAGGVALNLTEASRVFIVDPWWNPAAEWQSADRCHRIGQKRPCVITRLCIEDSVESRIVMLQEKKAHMINGTVNGDDVAMEKLTPEDMQFLFRGT